MSHASIYRGRLKDQAWNYTTMRPEPPQSSCCRGEGGGQQTWSGLPVGLDVGVRRNLSQLVRLRSWSMLYRRQDHVPSEHTCSSFWGYFPSILSGSFHSVLPVVLWLKGTEAALVIWTATDLDLGSIFVWASGKALWTFPLYRDWGEFIGKIERPKPLPTHNHSDVRAGTLASSRPSQLQEHRRTRMPWACSFVSVVDVTFSRQLPMRFCPKLSREGTAHKHLRKWPGFLVPISLLEEIDTGPAP